MTFFNNPGHIPASSHPQLQPPSHSITPAGPSNSLQLHQHLPPPESAKLHANSSILSSSSTARPREPVSHTTKTHPPRHASHGKLFRITPGPSQLRVIPPSEVVVVPESEEEDTEEDEVIPNLSRVLGKRRSDPDTLGQLASHSTSSSSQTKHPSNTQHASSNKHQRPRTSHPSISSRPRPMNGAHSSRPSSSHDHSLGTYSKPVRLDLSEASSSESIVLLQSPPNTFRRPHSTMPHSTERKGDKSDRSTLAQADKRPAIRSNGFGAHAKTINGQIIPPTSRPSGSLIDQIHAESERVRTVGGKDKALASTQIQSMAKADDRSYSFGRSVDLPGKPRERERHIDQHVVRPRSSRSPSRHTQSSGQKTKSSGSSSIHDQSSGHGVSSSRTAQQSTSSSRAAQLLQQFSSTDSQNHSSHSGSSFKVDARPKDPFGSYHRTPGSTVSRDPHRGPHKASSSNRSSPLASSRPSHSSTLKGPRPAAPFPMHMPGSYPGTSSPATSASQPPKQASTAIGGQAAAANIQQLATSLRPATPPISTSHRTEHRFDPARRSSGPNDTGSARHRQLSHSSSSSHVVAPRPIQRPASTHRPSSSISSRPAAIPNSHRSSVSPVKRRRESRPIEEEESYRPKKRSQTVAESPEISRPKRARPEPGRYTIPTLDAEKWPTKKGSYGATSGKRKATSTVKTERLTVPARSAQRSSSLSSAPATSLSPVAHTRPLDSTSSLTLLPSSSQSPNKSSKNSTPRLSHFNRRQSSTLSPPAEETEVQGSEEEEEPVEDQLSSEEQEPVEGAPAESVDLLADFEDFQFEPESPKAVRSLPGSQTQIIRTPERSTDDVFFTPKSRPSALTPRTPSRKPVNRSPFSASKRLLSPHHPTPIMISPKYLKNALATHAPAFAKAKISHDEILAAHDRKATEAKELAQREREERQRQMAAYTAMVEAEEVEEEEEQIEDLGALLETAKDEPRQSARLRSASTDIDIKPKPNLGKRRVPSDFDLLMREHKRNERRGVSGPQVDAVLAVIGESADEGKGVPYPTPPISGDGEDEEEEEEDETLDDAHSIRPRSSRQITGMSLKAVLQNVPEGLIDDAFVWGMAAGEEEEQSEEIEQRRPAFWTSKQERSFVDFQVPPLDLVGQGPLADLLRVLCRDQNMDNLALCVSTGVFDITLETSSNAQLLFDWLLRLALGDGSSKLDSIRPALICLLQKHTDIGHDFVRSERCIALFASINVNPALLSRDHEDQAYVVTVNRELAASLMCELIIALPELDIAGSDTELAKAAASGALLCHDLAADHFTSKSLQYSARQAAQRLVFIAAQADLPSAIAFLVDGAPKPLELMDVHMPTLMGSSQEHQEAVSWLSCALLGARVDFELKPLPMMDTLLPLAEDIFHELNRKRHRPDQIKVESMIELLTVAFGGLNDFIERCGRACGAHSEGTDKFDAAFTEFKKRVTMAMWRIPIRMVGSVEHDNRCRLSQLEVNLGMLYKLAVARWERQRVKRMRGLRQAEAGAKQGQLRLDFAPAS